MAELNKDEVEYDSTRHPFDEELIRYFSGTLPEGTHEIVQVHLVDCDHCLETFTDVRDFFELHRRGEQMINEDLGQQWKEFATRIREVSATTGRQPEPRPQPSRVNMAAVLALAATVIIAVVLGLLALSQRREKQKLAQQLQTSEQRNAELQTEKEKLTDRLSRLEQDKADLKERSSVTPDVHATPRTAGKGPEVNVPIYDLYARDFNRRSAGDSEVNRISPPASANSIVLILNGSGVASSPSYELEITGQNGLSIWRGHGLRKERPGNLTMTIDRALLRKGTYRFKLYAEHSTNALAEYLLRVE